MNKIIVSFTGILLLVLANCAVSKPLTYAALERPTGPIESPSKPEGKFSEGKLGIFYVPPANTEKIFNTAAERSNSNILRHFDIRYTVGTCYLFVCFGNDFIVVNNEDPDATDYSKF